MSAAPKKRKIPTPRQFWVQFWDYFRHRLLKIPLTMAVRYDFCRSKKPELTVIFLHGISASFSSWRETAKQLADDRDLSHVRLIGLDLIGFGRSESPTWFGYDYESYRRVITHTLHRLRVKTPVILAGHSMGCLIAGNYAESVEGAVKRLVYVSPPIMHQRESAGVRNAFYNKAYTDLSNNIETPIVQLAARIADRFTSFEKSSLNTFTFHATMMNIILNKDNWNSAIHLKVPTTTIHGIADPLVIGNNLRSIAKQNSHFELIETVGAHDITGVKRKRTVAAIKRVCLEELLRS